MAMPMDGTVDLAVLNPVSKGCLLVMALHTVRPIPAFMHVQQQMWQSSCTFLTGEPAKGASTQMVL